MALRIYGFMELKNKVTKLQVTSLVLCGAVKN
jgi:hypothetical protein